MMDPVPLDPDLVAKFNDKTMAIVSDESGSDFPGIGRVGYFIF